MKQVKSSVLTIFPKGRFMKNRIILFLTLLLSIFSLTLTACIKSSATPALTSSSTNATVSSNPTALSATPTSTGEVASNRIFGYEVDTH